MPKPNSRRGGAANGDHCCSTDCSHRFDHAALSDIFRNNVEWAESITASDPEFFDRLAHQQSPEFLFIGCSDSRVPANQIMGLAPGEVFVQRNVGNQCLHHDMNVMSCIEYAVKALKVKTVIVCGHYNCGAVRAALTLPSKTPGLVNCWISDIREARNQAVKELSLLDQDEAFARLCELNVLRQVFHVCTSPVVQSAWAEGQELHVWGMIYDVADGRLKALTGPLNSESDVNALRFDASVHLDVPTGGAKPKPQAPGKAAAGKAPAKKRARTAS